MLRYLQWLAIAGVWGPVVAVCGWLGLAWLLAEVKPDFSGGWGLVAVGMYLAVACAHAVAISSLVGVSLLASRRTVRPSATAVSAVVGGAIAVVVLGRVYLNFGL